MFLESVIILAACDLCSALLLSSSLAFLCPPKNPDLNDSSLCTRRSLPKPVEVDNISECDLSSPLNLLPNKASAPEERRFIPPDTTCPHGPNLDAMLLTVFLMVSSLLVSSSACTPPLINRLSINSEYNACGTPVLVMADNLSPNKPLAELNAFPPSLLILDHVSEKNPPILKYSMLLYLLTLDISSLREINLLCITYYI